MIEIYFVNQIDLTSHRGGCIICMDYGAYSQSYPNLLILFNKIAEIFTAKLIALKKYNFSPFTAFLFGFSVGARIVVKGAIDFGKYQIGRIDGKRTSHRKNSFKRNSNNLHYAHSM